MMPLLHCWLSDSPVWTPELFAAAVGAEGPDPIARADLCREITNHADITFMHASPITKSERDVGIVARQCVDKHLYRPDCKI